MNSKWVDAEAREFIERYGQRWGEDLALRTYTSRLLGSEPSLVLHGGGNTSVKTTVKDVFGEPVKAIFVKASGWDLTTIEPEGHSGLEWEPLARLSSLETLSDEEMVKQNRSRLLDYRAANPSIETLVHAFIPAKFVDHTHAGSVLALCNQVESVRLLREALGDEAILLDYVKPGFDLAKATWQALGDKPDARLMVWNKHGIVTWGPTARESYELMIETVTRTEEFIRARRQRRVTVSTDLVTQAGERYVELAPLMRGALAEPTGSADQPWSRVILRPLIDDSVLSFLALEQAGELALAPPVTSDHLIRTKAYPLWLEAPAHQDTELFRKQFSQAVADYRSGYLAYVDRNSESLEDTVGRVDSAPRVVCLPGVGVICAGTDVTQANICRDIMVQTLAIKEDSIGLGTYQGLSEGQLVTMEYRAIQTAKLTSSQLPLSHHVAVVTGAAGAIGTGICRELLEQGCHVAATDVAEERLQKLVGDLRDRFGKKILGVSLDVTSPESVANGFSEIVSEWGGVDLIIVNAGVALVSSLAKMKLEAFRRLERVNVEGSLLVLAESARALQAQGTGGDIILVSTKNVFAPGARFGAYSATKAAAHQLARIASLELASEDIRVNMVAPDAVFEEGDIKSGLWAEVGPDRMRARGLDEDGLQEYYRNRNLLKIRVTAQHVANAVLFFATRQTPTTGATIPVDGGLPDSTPR